MVRKASVIAALAMTTAIIWPRAYAGQLDTAETLLQAFGCQPLRLSELPPVDLIIDDSKSMRGFVRTHHGGRYAAVLQQLLKYLSDNAGGIRRLNRPNHVIAQPLDIYDEAFYSADETPLEQAFRYARTHPDRITVLVSDLQQSTTPGTVQEASLALKHALASTPHVLLVGIRSPYSIQTNPPCSPSCLSHESRHVYVMVLTGSSDQLRLFVEMTHIVKFANSDPTAIEEGGGQPPFFYSWRPAAEVTDLQIADDLTASAWSESKHVETVDCGDELLPRCVIHIQRDGKFGTEALHLLLRVSVHGPLTDSSRKTSDVRKLSLSSTEPPQPFSDPRFVVDNAGPVPLLGDRSLDAVAWVKLEYNPILHLPRRWDVYQISFELGPAIVQIPPWVRLWEEKSPKTPHEMPAVAALVRTMVRNVTQHRPALEHFVAIHRE